MTSRRMASLVATLLAVAVAANATPEQEPTPPVGQINPSPLPATIDLSPLPRPVESTQRATSDRKPDASQDPQTHVIYFIAAGAADEMLDIDGTITASLRSMRAWFAAQSSKRPRVDLVSGTTNFDITFVRGEADQYTGIRAISDELVRRGFDEPNKRYLVYAGGINRNSPTCGEGFYGLPGMPRGRMAVVYLDSSSGCYARDFGDGTAAGAGMADGIAAHEWLHNEGVVPLAAPRHCPISLYHVCTGPLAAIPEADPEALDVMFPYTNVRLGSKVLDLGKDDYLDHPWPHLPNLRDSTFLCPPAAPAC